MVVVTLCCEASPLTEPLWESLQTYPYLPSRLGILLGCLFIPSPNPPPGFWFLFWLGPDRGFCESVIPPDFTPKLFAILPNIEIRECDSLIYIDEVFVDVVE